MPTNDYTALLARHPVRDAWRVFRQNRAAMLGLVLLIVIVGSVICAPLLTSYSPIAQSFPDILRRPCAEHIFGCDHYGRDYFSRCLYGGRLTLMTGFSATLIAVVFGSLFGFAAGYCGGAVDGVIMRLMDILASIPSLILAILVVAVTGVGTDLALLAIGVSLMPAYVRLLRASVLTVMSSEYIEASRALGSRHGFILLHHVLRNVLPPMVVHIAQSVGDALLAFSALGYMSLSVTLPTPEWGYMIYVGRTYIRSELFLVLFPTAGIVLTTLALDLIGDGLRDALDPLMQQSVRQTGRRRLFRKGAV